MERIAQTSASQDDQMDGNPTQSPPLPFNSTNQQQSNPPTTVQNDAIVHELPAAGPAPINEMPSNLVQAELPGSSPGYNSQPMPTIEIQPDPTLVTPLHMLGEAPQTIDCPFCQKRTKTRVDKKETSMQTVVGVVLCLFCICLACLPCMCGWFENLEYYCNNCGTMVALRPHDGAIQVFGPNATPGPAPSQYPPAHPQSGTNGTVTSQDPPAQPQPAEVG